MLRWPFLLVVALAPLPLGSNRPIPWTLLALTVGVRLLAWSVLMVLRLGWTVVVPDRFWPAVAGLALVVGVALLQMSALALRSWQHPLWLQAGGVLGGESRRAGSRATRTRPARAPAGAQGGTAGGRSDEVRGR